MVSPEFPDNLEPDVREKFLEIVRELERGA
jgi:hypothetical protein